MKMEPKQHLLHDFNQLLMLIAEFGMESAPDKNHLLAVEKDIVQHTLAHHEEWANQSGRQVLDSFLPLLLSVKLMCEANNVYWPMKKRTNGQYRSTGAVGPFQITNIFAKDVSKTLYSGSDIHDFSWGKFSSLLASKVSSSDYPSGVVGSDPFDTVTNRSLRLRGTDAAFATWVYLTRYFPVSMMMELPPGERLPFAIAMAISIHSGGPGARHHDDPLLWRAEHFTKAGKKSKDYRPLLFSRMAKLGFPKDFVTSGKARSDGTLKRAIAKTTLQTTLDEVACVEPPSPLCLRTPDEET
jgi:hypothetical protein